MDKIVIMLFTLMFALGQNYATGWGITVSVIAWAAFALTTVRLITLLVGRRKHAEKLR